jgi:hypothetical protein
MEIYMEIDSKAVYPHKKERERERERERESGQEFTYPANLQAQMEGIKIQKLRMLQGRRLSRAHALRSHIHGLNPLMGEGSI